MIYIIYIPLIIYCFIWGYLFVGFLKTSCQTKINAVQPLSLSIVIPFRNERLRWNDLLESLVALDQGSCELEIIFIDDHSSDDGVDHLKKWILGCDKPVSLISLSEGSSGKKQAIEKAIETAKYDWIFTLDADSAIHPSFLTVFAAHMEVGKSVYLMPVIEKDNGFFLSKVEADMLSVISFCSVGHQWPLLANGAGMIYKKELFNALRPYANNSSVLSGDDLFFLEKLIPKKRHEIQSFNNKELTIITDSPKSYFQMLIRAVRWSTKMSRVQLTRTKFVGLVVFLCNVSLFPIVLYHICSSSFYSLYIVLGFKFLIDFLLLLLNKKNELTFNYFINSILTFIFYPFHLLVVLSYSIFNRSKWKGRNI